MPFFTPLPHRALIAVRGEDRVGFLQGLVSNDMAKVEAGSAVWAAFLTPQGKFLHEFFAVAHQDVILLECERARRDDLVTRLSRYKLRAKVTLAADDTLTVGVAWGEGASVAFGGGGALAMTNDVTWLHRLYPATLWTTPGGQFNPAVSSSRAVGGVGYYTWPTSTQLVADVQAMLNANATNFGWCVLGNETTLQSVKRFDARESGVAASRPQLTVVYFPPTSYDLTGDNKINASDLAILLGSWGGSGAADFNHDGVVAAQDLSLLLSAWTG
jgi:folate-binding Fe-S cluster repair protein YgfZ